MNRAETLGDLPTDLPALSRLLIAYAPQTARGWQALCWQLDQRLAAVARRGGDPMIAAIRIAWWDEVLVSDDRQKGGGEPLVEQWRATAPPGAALSAERLIDGWRLLVAPDPLSDADLGEFARARGGGLFSLLAGRDEEAVVQAGSIWALRDLAVHVRDDGLARRAMGLAQELVQQSGPPHGLPRPLQLLMAVILPDVRAGRVPTADFTLRNYGRLLIASLRR